MRDCEAYIEQISVLLDGELSEYETEVLMAHLDTCPECRIFYDAFTSISENTASLAVAAPEGFADGVMIAVENDIRIRTLKRRRFSIGRITTVAACLTVVLFAASRLSQNNFSGGNASLLGTTEGIQDESSKAADAPEAAEAPRIFAAGGAPNFGSGEEAEDLETIVNGDMADGGTRYDADYNTSIMESVYAPEAGEIAGSEPDAIPDTALPASTGAPTVLTVKSLDAVLGYSNFFESAASSGEVDLSGTPAMIIEADNEGEFLTITLWEADGKLYCGVGSTLYIAEGTLEGFLAFIAES